MAKQSLKNWTTHFLVVTSLVTSMSAPALSKEAVVNDTTPAALVPSLPEENTEDIAKLLSPDSPVMTEILKSNLLAQLQEEFDKAMKETVTEKNEKKQVVTMSRWQKEIAKAKIKIQLKGDTDLSKLNLNVKAGYTRNIAPTNANGEQRLTDIIELEIGNVNSLRAALRVKFSFSKVFKPKDFPNKNIKSEALFSGLYWVTDVPFSGSEVLTKMKVEETVRLEVDGTLGLYGRPEKIKDNVKSFAGVGYKRGATFLMDIGRITPTYTRVRFVGLKNRGSFDANLGFRKFLTNSRTGGTIGKALSIGVDLGFEIGDRLFYNYPVDSMMVMYGFNMAQPEAIEALDEVLGRTRKVGFIKLFDPTAEEKDLAKKLLAQAPKAETYAKEDRNKGPNDFRVKHEFRGRMTSQYHRTKLSGNASIFIEGKYSEGGSSTFVRQLDDADQEKNYLLMSQFIESSIEAGIGNALVLTSDRMKHAVDYFLHSDKDKVPGAFIEFVSRQEVEASSLNASDLEALKKRMLLSVNPNIVDRQKLENYLPTGRQESASYVFESSISPNGYKALAKIDRAQMVQNLIDFLDNHPEKQLMRLNDQVVGDGSSKPLFETAEEIAYPLKRILENSARTETTKDYSLLQAQPVFGRWVVSEFLPSQVPTNGQDDMMRYSVRFSSNNGTLEPLVIGQSTTTNVYQAVTFFRRVLEDRGFEMRIEELDGKK